MIDLFQYPSGNDLYNQLKKDDVSWHNLARNYWNEVYNNYKKYLDVDFPLKFPTEFKRRLWELKLLNYFSSLKQGSLDSFCKKDIVIPDLKYTLKDESYYIEAICPQKGSSENYPYLNSSLSTKSEDGVLLARNCSPGYREYRERLTSAFREKAICKYDPSSCDLNVCHHKQKNGYKENIENLGFIIAISMADIDFWNQPMNPRVDLSCFFPMSPHMSVDIDKTGKIYDSYHTYNPSFNKRDEEDKPISVDIFDSPKYSHVSAVIISQRWQVLFPNLSSHHSSLHFGETDNDFMLIHNPFADYKLETGLLPVESEFMAKEIEGKVTINNVSCPQENIS